MSGEETKIKGISLGNEGKYDNIREFYRKKPRHKETEELEFLTKTEFSETEIICANSITLINSYVKEEWGFDLKLDRIVLDRGELNISLNRKGREEWVEVAKEPEISAERAVGNLRQKLGIPATVT